MNEELGEDTKADLKKFAEATAKQTEAEAAADRKRIAEEAEASRRKKHEESTGNQRAIMAQQRAHSEKLGEACKTIERMETKLASIEGTSGAASVKTDLFAPDSKSASAFVPDDPSVAAPGAPDTDPENLKLKARLAREESKIARLRKEKQALEQRAREAEVGRKDAEEKFNAVSYEPNPKSNPTEIRPQPQKPTGRNAAARETYVKNTREHRRKQTQAAENGQRWQR